MIAIRENPKERNAIKIKKQRKHKKKDSQESFLKDSDSSNKSDYTCKRHKNNKSHQKIMQSNYAQG